jgi:hypothetical protein
MRPWPSCTGGKNVLSMAILVAWLPAGWGIVIRDDKTSEDYEVR